MKARDVMVRNVFTIGADEDVARAAKMLVDHDISALPVVDEERRILGILSERTSSGERNSVPRKCAAAGSKR